MKSSMRISAVVFGAAMLGSSAARAEDVPMPAPLGAPVDSASRDVPVLEFAYGPRAQLSIGHALRLVRSRRWSLDVSALAAFEDAASHGPLADELGRLVLVGSLGAGLAAPGWLGEGAQLRVGVDLGLERARELRTTETREVLPAPRPGDIPFGGGGAWTGFSAALGLPLGATVDLELALRERIFLNAWPRLFGAEAASDTVADSLGEGLVQAPALEARLRWRVTPCVRPFVALFAEALLPHDRSADASGFARILAGVGLGTFAPFVSFDVGSGKGLLVNRHEARLSLGVRHSF